MVSFSRSLQSTRSILTFSLSSGVSSQSETGTKPQLPQCLLHLSFPHNHHNHNVACEFFFNKDKPIYFFHSLHPFSWHGWSGH